LLLGLGADPNQTCGRMQTSPLHVAFELNEPEIARKLLFHGADIEYTSVRGWSVIHHIWEHVGKGKNSLEFYEICSAEDFSSYDVQDGMGWTCLHRAAAYGTRDDIQSLVRRGASTAIHTTPLKWSPIHVAAVMNNLNTLAALAEHCPGLALHSPDAYGWTPLHRAVYREAEDTMAFLLKKGANPHAQTYVSATWFPAGFEHEVLTPGDLAISKGYHFLKKYTIALNNAGWDTMLDLEGDGVYWDASEKLREEV